MTTYVKYIGLSQVRMITADQWRDAGLDGETVKWDFTNAFMVPADKFTDEQLRVAIHPDTSLVVVGTDEEPRRLEHDMTPAQAATPRIRFNEIVKASRGTDGAPDDSDAATDPSGPLPERSPGGDAPRTRATGRGSGKD